MEYYFKYKLDAREKERFINHYESFDFVSIDQHPDWCVINNPQKRVCFFYASEGEEIICSAAIIERFGMATVLYGPVAKNPDALITCILEIKNHYRKKRYGLLTIKLGMPTGQISEYIENNIYRESPFVQHFNQQNWSSLIIKLEDNIENIYNKFSDNHKRSIKKAQVNELTVKEIDCMEDIKTLSTLYDKMYVSRKIIKSFDNTEQVFAAIYEFFKKYHKGIILGVFGKDETLQAGIILPFQGKTVYYQYGASNPDNKQVPLLHIAFYEALKISKQRNFHYFDFGGYVHLAKEKEQVYNINKFKSGFSGEYIFYPKIMYFRLNYMKYKLITFLKIFYFYYRKVLLLFSFLLFLLQSN